MILGNGSGYERKAAKRHVYGVGDLIDSKELMSEKTKRAASWFQVRFRKFRGFKYARVGSLPTTVFDI